jgi:hypothetical protein
MNQKRMKRVAKMIAVFAGTLNLDNTNDERKDTLWLIKRYCKEYEELMDMEEEE